MSLAIVLTPTPVSARNLRYLSRKVASISSKRMARPHTFFENFSRRFCTVLYLATVRSPMACPFWLVRPPSAVSLMKSATHWLNVKTFSATPDRPSFIRFTASRKDSGVNSTPSRTVSWLAALTMAWTALSTSV